MAYFYHVSGKCEIRMSLCVAFHDMMLINFFFQITGGSSGIGKALAIEAVKNGANVTIMARNEVICFEALCFYIQWISFQWISVKYMVIKAKLSWL